MNTPAPLLSSQGMSPLQKNPTVITKMLLQRQKAASLISGSFLKQLSTSVRKNVILHFVPWSVACGTAMTVEGLIIRWGARSFSSSASFATAPFHCLNPITWLSLNACCLCLLCCYPLAPSYFDKLGHENEPPCCQENAKYRPSFLQLWFFNQLPLISALHPLFLSFQNVMEEKSAHCQHPFLLTPLPRSPYLLVHLSTDVLRTHSIGETSSCHLAYTLPSCIFSFSSFPHSLLVVCLSPVTHHPLLTCLWSSGGLISFCTLISSLLFLGFIFHVLGLFFLIVVLIKMVKLYKHRAGSTPAVRLNYCGITRFLFQLETDLNHHISCKFWNDAWGSMQNL